MNLFMLGDFTLNSGAKSTWKLECDALTDEDIEGLAEMIRMMVGAYGSVEGVPRGGLRLAKALEKYVCTVSSFVPHPHLIVDDVLTTGGSMERLRDKRSHLRFPDGQGVIGAVIFARGQCPHWVKAVFQMPECFWTKPKTR